MQRLNLGSLSKSFSYVPSIIAVSQAKTHIGCHATHDFFLTSNLQLIKFEKLFFGTHSRVKVYPRRVVKQALQHNTAKLVIAHNHPSQDYIPSCADKYITQKIKKILDIIDVELIDHIIVTRYATYSFAECGLL